ncbi:SRPBCC family protein [Actinophytocola sp. NPDC049390]|uniref:SRPBCC family protein n=1 Tax=Actinophytocola sp. NPDC049390 TaxID=3363894 RepID=UPI0037B73BDD
MSHVITSVTVEIAAPASVVWAVLTDFAHYPQWNPYTVAVTSTLEIGTPIDLTLPNPDGSAGTFVNREWVRVVEPPHHLRYDTASEMPGIFAVRDQWVTPLDDKRCTYHTTDTISGKYADKVMEMTGDWVKAGFDSVAIALQARAEALGQGTTPS